MSDDPPSSRDDEAAVRRLLSQARHGEGIPADVAARIEHAIADEQRATAEPGAASAPMVSMSRRRRQRATAMLVAAVSVVVIGIGLGQVLQPGESSDSATSESAGATQQRAREVAPDRAERQDEQAPERQDEQAPGLQNDSSGEGERDAPSPTPDAATNEPADTLLLAGSPPEVGADTFARDVRAVRRQSRQAAGSPRLQPDRAPTAGFSCDLGDLGPGRAVAVTFEQAPAVLLLRPRTQETQVVDLVSCEDAEVLRSVTLAD